MIDPLCITYGVMISAIISWLKQIPLIEAYPKTFTAVLAAFIPLGIQIAQFALGHPLASATAIASCFVTQFGTAVTTHETITHTINKLST